jgi:DNA-binding LacI/PurR family transcriptional regulator
VSIPGPGGHRRPTLEAVAAAAGVSRATASRVLRGASNVSTATRTAVLAAAGALSYTPNRAARSLVTGRSQSMVFLVEEPEDRFFSDPFFLGMLRSAHARTAAAGYQLVFTVASTPRDRQQFLSYAAGGHVDGVLVLSLHGDDAIPEALQTAGVPTVLSGRPLSGAGDLYYVDADNAGGAGLATEHLVRSGRNRIATVTGPLDMCAGQDRLRGYRSALRKAGIRRVPSLEAPGGFSISGGFDAMSALLSRHRDIDAVFAASDLMAIGAMRAIELSGRSVGDDVAVMGFDDIPEAANARPALSTVRQPISELGATMVDRLLAIVDGTGGERETVLPVELVLRQTA